MPQGGTPFTEWFPKVKDQADRCIWKVYDAKQAARDAILFQTESTKLQKKIIAEELDYDNTVKYGLAFEQGEAKVQQMREQKTVVGRPETEKIAQLEEQFRQLQVGKKRNNGKCRTFTRGGHEGRKCPGLKLECFSCQEKGHMQGSAACKKPKTGAESQDKKRILQGSRR